MFWDSQKNVFEMQQISQVLVVTVSGLGFQSHSRLIFAKNFLRCSERLEGYRCATKELTVKISWNFTF